MNRSNVALAIAVIALIGLVVHVFIPTPPAHTLNPFGVRA